jgi:N-acetylmuramoyl-L-alanine amidase
MNIIDLALQFILSKLSGVNIPRILYLHHSAGVNTVEAYHDQHKKKGWAGLGYNFIVGLDGKVYKGRDPKFIPAGCLGFNTNSLHICAIGNFDNIIMPEVQKQALKELVQYCKIQFPTLTAIKGHKEAPYATACPGKNYPLAEIKDVFVNGLAPVVTPKPTPSPIRAKVFKLQHILNELGYTDENGNRLIEDGWIGAHTLAALKKAVVRRGDKNKLVGWIQEQLAIKVDNSYGKSPYHETYDAICDFQRAKELKVDGVVGNNTWSKLIG